MMSSEKGHKNGRILAGSMGILTEELRDCGNAKHLLLFTLTLPLRGAFGGRVCSFFLVRERTNQESGPKGSALWIPEVRGGSYRYFRPEAKMFINIFPRLRK